MPLGISAEDRSVLNSWVRSSTVPAKVALRARIVLAVADGLSTAEVCETVGVTHPTVAKWRERFRRDGPNGLYDDPRSGRPSRVDESEVVVRTMEGPPADSGLTHWSSRELGKRMGISHNEVASIWRNWGLKPHRSESFKFSTDPELEAKITDVVGLYLNPPENAVVLCVDEKSQVQALERSQPMLPVAPGLAEHRAHDYFRHGITNLFAALNVATGDIAHACHPKHTNIEFLAFLKQIAKQYPNQELHIVVDNYRTHKHENVKAWLAKPANRRIILHFTPTGCSWLNLVEVFFSIITRQAIRRGSFNSVKELIAAISRFITSYNSDCKPFTWTKPADVIITKATGRRRTNFIKKGTSITRY